MRHITERTGDEISMLCYEHIFVLEKPIAGVDEVWTLHGIARFTTANRCVVITDGQRLVILDREKDHCVRLEIPRAQWFDASVEESSIVLSCYKQHGGRKLAQRFVIEAHSDHNSTLVPEGWPWNSTLFPESTTVLILGYSRIAKIVTLRFLLFLHCAISAPWGQPNAVKDFHQ